MKTTNFMNQVTPNEEKKGSNHISILLFPFKLTFWPFILIFKVVKRMSDKEQKAPVCNPVVESLEQKVDAPKKSIDKSSVSNAKGSHKRWILVILGLVLLGSVVVLLHYYNKDKYAIKNVCTLSNGNVIVKQLQKKSALSRTLLREYDVRSWERRRWGTGSEPPDRR